MFCTSIAMRIVDLPIEPGKVASKYRIAGQGKTCLLVDLCWQLESAYSASFQVTRHNILADNTS